MLGREHRHLMPAPDELLADALNVELHPCPVWKVIEHTDQNL